MSKELFANIAQNALSVGINNSTTSLSVVDASTFPVSGNFRIRVDNELLLVTGVSGTTFTVTRGIEGTSATSHSAGAQATHVLTSAALAIHFASLEDENTFVEKNTFHAHSSVGVDSEPDVSPVLVAAGGISTMTASLTVTEEFTAIGSNAFAGALWAEATYLVPDDTSGADATAVVASAAVLAGAAQNWNEVAGLTCFADNANSGTISQLYGFVSNVVSRAGTITYAAGSLGGISVAGGTVSNAYGQYLSATLLSGAGAVVNNYGIYIEDFSGVGSGDRFSIYSAGGTAYFESQVWIGTATGDAAAKLQVDSTTQGFLPPRMTTTQRNAISSPPEGLVVWDTTLHKLYVYNGTIWIVVPG